MTPYLLSGADGLKRHTVCGIAPRNESRANEFNFKLEIEFRLYATICLLKKRVSIVVYSKQEILGEGGFAQVFRVTDEQGNEFALKEFSPQKHIINQVGKDSLHKRFLREVRHQISIQHNNVVRIIEANLTATPPFFIMEKADCTLNDELKADRTLGGNPEKVLYDIISGIEALHELEIVHRDLKPANVLRIIDASGVARYAISDFGLMTAVNSDSTNLTDSGQGGGTQLYSAPELMNNFKRATPQSDIYSIGAILHDIFGNGKRVPYTELTADGKIGDIISKCTKKQPRRRYQSITELRENLYEVLSSEDIKFHSSDEEKIINLLTKSSELSDEEWDEVFDLIDDNADNDLSNLNIFRSITNQHIINISTQAPELFVSLGKDFCEFVQNGTAFDFDYCDVLANKIQSFYDYGGIELKSLSAIAMLELGTSHNRWYVEHKFMKMVNLNIDNNLALRIKIELENQGINVENKISHVENSIGVSRTDVHPDILN
ncbi:MAG: serine/threonine-protein kinase [Cellvibrionaceae bacterium]